MNARLISGIACLLTAASGGHADTLDLLTQSIGEAVPADFGIENTSDHKFYFNVAVGTTSVGEVNVESSGTRGEFTYLWGEEVVLTFGFPITDLVGLELSAGVSVNSLRSARITLKDGQTWRVPFTTTDLRGDDGTLYQTSLMLNVVVQGDLTDTLYGKGFAGIGVEHAHTDLENFGGRITPSLWLGNTYTYYTYDRSGESTGFAFQLGFELGGKITDNVHWNVYGKYHIALGVDFQEPNYTLTTDSSTWASTSVSTFSMGFGIKIDF
jgi:hypothetical protein